MKKGYAMNRYTYRCADCLGNGVDFVEELTVEAPSKSIADKIVRHSNLIDTDEAPRPMSHGDGVIATELGNREVVWGSKWKFRGENPFTAKGWVGPYCNYRVQDLEYTARSERASNLRYYR